MRIRARVGAALGTVLVLGGSLPPAPPAALCGPATEPLRPSADLYCLDLVLRPDVPTGRGTVELGRARSPFDVAVTAEGNQRYDGTLVLDSLPPPESLGAYTAYVAWVAPPNLDPMIKLGVVRNGRNPLGEIRFDKFLVFVTAERSGAVAERTGRLVLRGMSPSIRMQQHSMLIMTRTVDSINHAGMDHSGHKMAAPEGAPAAWFMPPSRPGVPMMPMPGVDELVPPVEPYLPGRGIDARSLPEAKPRTVVRLRGGDTLDLTASLVRRTINGRTLVMFAYNGQYPGPLIRVDEGVTAVVRFRNAIDQPTAVHWHGIRLENRSDGVPGVTQDPVEPGSEFLYRIHFRDAGIYWYHPHLREDIQQDLGLYGNILVRPKRPDAFGPAHREETLMLDDIVLGEPGLLPFGREHATHSLMGRFGNVFLINGEPSYQLDVKPREIVRFYVTNVSNTRTFNLTFPGATLKLVGADVGRYEQEEWTDNVPIAPAQRYIVDVRFPTAGKFAVMNQVQAIDHNVGNFFPEFDTLGTVTAAGPPIEPDFETDYRRLRTNRDVVTEVAKYRAWIDRAPDKRLLLTLQLGELPFGVMQMLRKDVMYSHPVEWSGTMPMMDWLPTARDTRWVLRDPATGLENMAVKWTFKVGDLVKIRIGNDRTSLHPMSHPIHMHGQRFLVLAHNDVPSPNLVWKDTVLVPVGGTVDLLVEMTNPGKWMMHCHIAEHLETGMMGVFEVH
ncbi:MAG: multicopper oxidase family protein [Gemmatimonadetes bacterium]|nr:multicopper oxidase family protein [Gemmatimonadota bacterium]